MLMDKQDLYRRVKIAGLISFIPFILLGAPLTGYFVGDFLVSKFSLPGFVTPVLIGLCLLGGISQVIRIIKLCIQNSQT